MKLRHTHWRWRVYEDHKTPQAWLLPKIQLVSVPLSLPVYKPSAGNLWPLADNLYFGRTSNSVPISVVVVVLLAVAPMLGRLKASSIAELPTMAELPKVKNF